MTLTPRILIDRLHALWPDLNAEKTVDRVIAGPSDQEVRGIAVCWMPYRKTLREAAERGANLVIAHEPTFYDHWEFRGEPGPEAMQPQIEAKRKEIEELGLTVIRCHDVWDAIQVPDRWAEYLQLGPVVGGDRYARVLQVEPQTAEQIARRIAHRTAESGQSTVGFYGDPARTVNRVAVGTGCYSDPLVLRALGADLVVAVDDILRSWIAGTWAEDEGFPIVVVNHGVSENCTKRHLADLVQSWYPELPVFWIPQGCSYREVRA